VLLNKEADRTLSPLYDITLGDEKFNEMKNEVRKKNERNR